MTQIADKSIIVTEADGTTPVFAFMGGDLRNCADDVIEWCLDNNILRWVRYQLPAKFREHTNHGLGRVTFCKDNDSVKKEVRDHIRKLDGLIICSGLVQKGVNTKEYEKYCLSKLKNSDGSPITDIQIKDLMGELDGR